MRESGEGLTQGNGAAGKGDSGILVLYYQYFHL
jgi:hypothetical protein